MELSREYTQHLYVDVQYLSNAVAIFNTIFSFLVVYLIFCLHINKNIYQTIIIALTFTQLVYDLSFTLTNTCSYITNVNQSLLCFQIQTFITLTSGFAAGLWTNFLSVVVMLIVVRRRSFVMRRKMKLTGAVITLISSAVGGWACYFYFNPPQYTIAFVSYTWLRLVQIIVNAIIFCVIVRELRGMRITEASHSPIYVLSTRLALYPLIQVVSRFGPSWYNLQYSQSVSKYPTHVPAPDLTQTVSLFFAVIFQPSAGFGYFMVYIIMQQGAYQELLRQICLLIGRKYVAPLRKSRKRSTQQALSVNSKKITNNMGISRWFSFTSITSSSVETDMAVRETTQDDESKNNESGNPDSSYPEEGGADEISESEDESDENNCFDLDEHELVALMDRRCKFVYSFVSCGFLVILSGYCLCFGV